MSARFFRALFFAMDKKLLFALAASAIAASGSAGAAVSAAPFAYPESLLAGNPAKGEAVAPGMTLGAAQVSLESTPIREIARTLGVPLSREGAGDFTRDWTCLEAGASRIWLIASDSPAVTEVQMAAKGAVSSKSGRCYKLKDEFSSVSIGGVAPGATKDEVLAKFGKPAYAGEGGWLFWAHFKTIEEYSNSRIQMNWTGVQVKDGKVLKVFSSQVTNP